MFIQTLDDVVRYYINCCSMLPPTHNQLLLRYITFIQKTFLFLQWLCLICNSSICNIGFWTEPCFVFHRSFSIEPAVVPLAICKLKLHYAKFFITIWVVFVSEKYFSSDKFWLIVNGADMNHKRISQLLLKINLHTIMVGSRVNLRFNYKSGMDSENLNVLPRRNDGNVDIVNLLLTALRMLNLDASSKARVIQLENSGFSFSLHSDPLPLGGYSFMQASCDLFTKDISICYSSSCMYFYTYGAKLHLLESRCKRCCEIKF